MFSMPNADCYTDHRLVKSKFQLTFNPSPKKGRSQMNKPNIERLQLLKEEFQAKLEERFNAEADKESRSEDPELHWQCLKSILQERKLLRLRCRLLNQEE